MHVLVVNVQQHARVGYACGERPRLVHRLDRDTSGILVVAKDRQTAARLGRLFQTRSVQKIYWAITRGVPKPLQRKVEASARQNSILDTALQQLPGIAGAAGDGASLPTQLTSRAARLLRRAHELLGQLRGIADETMVYEIP